MVRFPSNNTEHGRKCRVTVFPGHIEEELIRLERLKTLPGHIEEELIRLERLKTRRKLMEVILYNERMRKTYEINHTR